MILSIEEALIQLKNRYVLKSIVAKIETYFFLSNQKIAVRSCCSSYVLSVEMFANLFSTATFTFVEKKEIFEIDLEKDKEYYSWRQ